jgi:hypothetical protein
VAHRCLVSGRLEVQDPERISDMGLSGGTGEAESGQVA